jgi:hypothetical protein
MNRQGKHTQGFNSRKKYQPKLALKVEDKLVLKMSDLTPISGCYVRRCFECQPVLGTDRGSNYALPKRLNIHIFVNDHCAKSKDTFSSATIIRQTFPASRPDRARCVNVIVDWLDICEEVGGALGRRQKGEGNKKSLPESNLLAFWISSVRADLE